MPCFVRMEMFFHKQPKKSPQITGKSPRITGKAADSLIQKIAASQVLTLCEGLVCRNESGEYRARTDDLLHAMQAL